jgi:hypothetical protein
MMKINGGTSAFGDSEPNETHGLAHDSVTARLGLRESVLAMQAEVLAIEAENPFSPVLAAKRRALQQAYSVLGFSDLGE